MNRNYIKFKRKSHNGVEYIGSGSVLGDGIAAIKGNIYIVMPEGASYITKYSEKEFLEHFDICDDHLTEREIYNFRLTRDKNKLKAYAKSNHELKKRVKVIPYSRTIATTYAAVIRCNRVEINRLERNIRVWKYELSKLITLEWFKNKPE